MVSIVIDFLTLYRAKKLKKKATQINPQTTYISRISVFSIFPIFPLTFPIFPLDVSKNIGIPLFRFFRGNIGSVSGNIGNVGNIGIISGKTGKIEGTKILDNT